MTRSQSRTGQAARGASAKVRHNAPALKPAEHRGGPWGYAVVERLRSLIGRSGGVRRFADEVGISPSLVSSYLSGKRLPDSLSLRKIAERTGISLDWLLFGEGGDSPVMRGQSRPESTLAADVAAHVLGQAMRLAGTAFRAEEWSVDGERLLTAVVDQVVSNYRTLARRWEATATALMPVMELRAEYEAMAEILVRDLAPRDAVHWRTHTEQRAERAAAAVSRLADEVEVGVLDRTVDSGAYFPVPLSHAPLMAIVELAGERAARPFTTSGAGE